MAVNKIGRSSSLPPGAISRIGSGYTVSGYGSLEGDFPAGKYLIRSTAAFSASFGTNYDARDWSTGTSVPGDCVIETKHPTKVFEYISALPTVLNTGTSVPGASSAAAGITGNFVDGYPDTFSSAFHVSPHLTNTFANVTTHSVPVFSFRDSFYTWTTSGQSQPYTSTNLYTFTAVSGNTTGLPSATTFDARRWASNGSVAVMGIGGAVAYNTSPLTSPTWTQVTTTSSGSYVVYGKGIFLLYGTSSGFYSTNGVNWTATTLPTTFEHVAYQNGVFVGIPASSRQIYYSYDALTWTLSTGPHTTNDSTTGVFQSIAGGNGLFVAVGGTTTSVNAFHQYGTWWSTDGINWNRGQNPPYFHKYSASTALPEIAFLGNYFLCLANTSSAPIISMDGISWRKLSDTRLGFSNRSINFARNTRGFLIGGSNGFSSQYYVNLRQPNCYFEVYLLDSSVKTFL